MGPKTRNAIRDFQLHSGLPETGLLDEATLNALSKKPSQPDAADVADPELPAAIPQLAPGSAGPAREQDGGARDTGVDPVANKAEDGGGPPLSDPSRSSRGASAIMQADRNQPAGSWGPALFALMVLTFLLYVAAGLIRWVFRALGRALAPSRASEKEREAKQAPRVTPPVPVLSLASAPSSGQQQVIASPQPSKPVGQDHDAIALPKTAAQPDREVRAAPDRRGNQTRRSSSQRQGWVQRYESVTVAGREIGGMVYVGKPPLINKYGLRDKCRAYIDLSLPVARAGTDRGGQGMPYWPGYSDISPQCRATYLDWLANGRSDPSYDPGYMFLYFYGIERRFFVDSPSHDEKADLLQEVRRLSALYPENRSVQRYLGEFIQVAEVATSSLGELQPIFENPSWELPFSLKMALGARIEAGDPLGADWALSWLICHPDYSLRTPATRCPEEFKALFRLRFERTYPDGLKFSRPRKTLVATYRAASSEFDGTLAPEVNGKPVPDVSGLRKPVDIALQIAEEVMNDLDKFSRFLGRNPDGRGSVEAHALLPVELWPLFPSEEVGNLKAWASSIVTGGGLISVADVIARLEDAVPAKIGKRQLTDAADALARLGFGLAPDPRFALRSPKPGEQVVIFELGQQVEMLEEVSLAYRSALMEVALASFVAHADGHIAELERKSLMDRISSVEGLNAQESRRLRANLDWFLAVPPDLSLLRRKLKDLGPAHHAAMRAALVTTAHADGVIGSEEVAGIERVYKALGLDSGLVYSDLHAGEVDSSPRAVRAAPPGPPGEAIPAGKTPAGPALDASRIAAIRSDTERVSSVLGEVFSDNDEADEDATEEVPSILKGLDYKHAALVRELIERERWTEEEFEQLCARHKLLVAGALEAVNEWAFEFYDEALLDDYDGYEIAADVAVPLRIAFEKESRNVEIEAT